MRGSLKHYARLRNGIDRNSGLRRGPVVLSSGPISSCDQTFVGVLIWTLRWAFGIPRNRMTLDNVVRASILRNRGCTFPSRLKSRLGSARFRAFCILMPWPTTSRQSRGYGAEWDKKRIRILERDHYLCQCRHCKAAGRVSPASEVDHITPKAKGGSDDDSNLQAINSDCHKRKNLEDQGVKPKVRIGADGWPV